MLKKVLHTGIAVTDLEAAIEMYKTLGFEVGKRFEKPEPQASVAHVSNGEVTFELWEFHDTKHPQVEFIRNHIAILSDDLEADVEKLVHEGHELVIPVTEGVILRYAFVQDTAGTNYEIAAEKASS